MDDYDAPACQTNITDAFLQTQKFKQTCQDFVFIKWHVANLAWFNNTAMCKTLINETQDN